VTTADIPLSVELTTAAKCQGKGTTIQDVWVKTTAAPTATSVGKARVTVTRTGTAPAPWFVDQTIATTVDILPLEDMMTAVNNRSKDVTETMIVAPTTTSVERERVTATVTTTVEVTWCVGSATATEEPTQPLVTRMTAVKILVKAATVGTTAAPTTTRAGLERVTATMTKTVPENWCVGPATATGAITQPSAILTTAVNIQLCMVRVRVATFKVAVEAMNAVPTTISVMRERETVILTMTVPEALFVDLTTATLEDILHLVMMTTAVNIQIAMVQIKVAVVAMTAVPTTIHVMRERVTVILMMTALAI